MLLLSSVVTIHTMLPDVSFLVSNIAIANCFKTGWQDESDRRYNEFRILADLEEEVQSSAGEESD